MDCSNTLREQLRDRAETWANQFGVAHYKSLGQSPTVLFEAALNGSTHGNFHVDSWKAINSDTEWRKRLGKTHPRAEALPQDKRAAARELDSSNSSDALLMNCFCYPGACDIVLRRLGLPPQSERPIFGYKAHVALNDGTTDATEIDMKIGNLLFEAKLTEKNFTSSAKDHVLRYKNLATTFDLEKLPSSASSYGGYQLIRNVLAAAQLGGQLIVLIDSRRYDLLQEWGAVHTAIADTALRSRCGIKTWQEVAAASPTLLRELLAEKYGIKPD